MSPTMGTLLSLSRLNYRSPGCEAHPEVMQGTGEFHHEIANSLLRLVGPVEGRQKTAVRGKGRFCTATVSSLLAQEVPLIRGSLRLSWAIKKGVRKEGQLVLQNPCLFLQNSSLIKEHIFDRHSRELTAIEPLCHGELPSSYPSRRFLSIRYRIPNVGWRGSRAGPDVS